MAIMAKIMSGGICEGTTVNSSNGTAGRTTTCSIYESGNEGSKAKRELIAKDEQSEGYGLYNRELPGF